MLKRQVIIIALCLCLVMVAIIPVTASAAEYDTSSGWLDVFDYTILEDGNFFPLDNYQSFTVQLPIETNLFYVDMVLVIGANGSINLDQMNVNFVWTDSGEASTLNIMYIGGDLYRVYGSVTKGNYRSFELQFSNYDSKTYYITVESLRVQTVKTTAFLDVGCIELSSQYGRDSVSMGSPGRLTSLTQYHDGTSFSAYFWTNNWKKYDYIEFLITVTADSVNSIVCDDGGGAILPVDVNYVDGDNGTWTTYLCGVDVSGLDKSETKLKPTIHFRGYGSGTYSVTLHDVVGHINVEAPDQQVYWWTKLFDKLGEWFGGLSESVQSGIGSILDSEKNQANNQGNSSVGDMENAIPDYGQQFTDSVQTFAASFSYDGTDAVLPIPGIVIPEIAGLIPRTELWSGANLDFGQFLSMLPGSLVLLVQSLLTIALIVFCFKELYGTISYILTLRKDGG